MTGLCVIFIISRVHGQHKYHNSTVPTNSIHDSLTPAAPLHETSQKASRSNLDGIGKHGHAQERITHSTQEQKKSQQRKAQAKGEDRNRKERCGRQRDRQDARLLFKI